ncbi:MAG: hypothetical protein PHW60_03625 [Kiritimatiellae bacterium]|nr:hypothetical protein [Kiritimatiellia bacterium]
MTPEKYQDHHCPLEERVRVIEGDVSDIKNMVGNIYDRFDELVDTAEATYKTVSYEPSGSRCTSDDDLDFLDEDD